MQFVAPGHGYGLAGLSGLAGLGASVLRGSLVLSKCTVQARDPANCRVRCLVQVQVVRSCTGEHLHTACRRGRFPKPWQPISRVSAGVSESQSSLASMCAGGYWHDCRKIISRCVFVCVSLGRLMPSRHYRRQGVFRQGVRKVPEEAGVCCQGSKQLRVH